MINRNRVNRLDQESGMSLLEVMVAVVVLSVGLIGVASLMLTSMRNNDATLARTQSTMLANEMYEKILANLPGAAAGHYSVSFASTLPTTATPMCDTAICSTQQIAVWDIATWAARINKVLVGSDAEITVDSSVDPMVIQISIRFEALMEATENVASNETFTTETFTFRVRQ